MRKFHFILPAVLLSSCISTDIAGSISDIGRTEPKVLPAGEASTDIREGFPYAIDFYSKNGETYAEVPIVYVARDTAFIEYISGLNNKYCWCTYRHIPTYEEMKHLPVEKHIFRIAQQKYSMPGITYIGPAENFDKKGATHLGKQKMHGMTVHRFALHLPVRREWYNYALQPLAFAGAAVDIASFFTLGALTFPIVTGLDPEWAEPNYDISGIYRGDEKVALD